MAQADDNHTTPESCPSLTNLLAIWEAEELWIELLPKGHPVRSVDDHPFWFTRDALMTTIAGLPVTSTVELAGKIRIFRAEDEYVGDSLTAQALRDSIFKDVERLAGTSEAGASEAPDADWKQRLDAARAVAPPPIDPERGGLLKAARKVCREIAANGVPAG